MLKWKYLAGLLAAIAATSALAQTAYPDKPVRIVVPFSPGGGGDVQGRIIATKLSERLKQPFQVLNRPGAGSNIGTVSVAREAPDGYTLLLVTIATVVNQTLWANAGYEVKRDFAAVSAVSISPLLILVNPSVPARDLRELIDYVKANPGKLSYASGGVGIVTQIEIELLKQRTGIELLHIAFQGQAPAVTAVVGGHVAVICDSIASAMPFVKSGKLRALAITSKQRAADAPDIPTVVEQGHPDLANSAWYGLVAPANTPGAIVKTLSDAVRDVLKQPDTVRMLAQVGADPFPLGHDEFGRFMDQEATNWTKVLKAANIKMQ